MRLRSLPTVRLVIPIVEGAGHYPHVEFAEQTAKPIVDFVRAAFREGERDCAGATVAV